MEGWWGNGKKREGHALRWNFSVVAQGGVLVEERDDQRKKARGEKRRRDDGWGGGKVLRRALRAECTAVGPLFRVGEQAKCNWLLFGGRKRGDTSKGAARKQPVENGTDHLKNEAPQ
ncbi:hypothetical protein TRVL_05000 [Trypanosoma vivax]|nr:hypothetical protein TRVL_05000 [Trypanosoma vivax]